MLNPVLRVYLKIRPNNQLEVFSDPGGQTLWDQADQAARTVENRGAVQFYFIKDEESENIETADLFIIPQTVTGGSPSITRRDSPFYRPEETTHFIEDPGWSVKDPGNPQGKVPKTGDCIFAGELLIRGIPNPGPPLGPYKWGIVARGDAGQWLTAIDPGIWINP